MGRAAHKGSGALEITRHSLERDVFSPGETIHGCVVRHDHMITPHATVKITIAGQAESSLTYKSGEDDRRESATFDIIDPAEHEQVLFEGPLHIAAGGSAQRWDFSLTIPTHCAPTEKYNTSYYSPDDWFLPVDADSVSTHRLPDTFETGAWATGGFVNYWLRADLSYEQGGRTRTKHAILPVKLATPSRRPPLAQPTFDRHRIACKAASYKLLPGMESVSLSFTQKRQELFGSSKVPRIEGHLEFDVPQALQLDHPAVIPLRVRWVPDADKTSSELLAAPPDMRIESVRFNLKAITKVRCGFRSSSCTAEFKIYEKEWDVLHSDKGTAPILFSAGDQDKNANRDGRDLGGQLGLSLSSTTAYDQRVLGTSRRQLQHDFVTYNMMHHHEARLLMVARIGGVKVKVRVEWGVELLGPGAVDDSAMSGKPGTGRKQGENLPSYESSQAGSGSKMEGEKAVKN